MAEISVKGSWRGLISRLQTIASRGRCAILTVVVVVDDQGDILYYSAPKRTDLEPRSARDVIIEAMTLTDP